MKEIDIHTLTGVELEYAFAQATGMAVLGRPQGPFAIADNDKRTLSIFGGTPKKIFKSSFESDLSYVPLNRVLKIAPSPSVSSRLEINRR